MAELAYSQRCLTEDDYRDFEAMFPKEIPLSFKSHYMAHNGGHTTKEDNEAGRWGLPVNSFNSIKYGQATIETLIDDLDASINTAMAAF
jgi:hypothetical protein